jgi:outer membrane protein assembly factor BamB
MLKLFSSFHRLLCIHGKTIGVRVSTLLLVLLSVLLTPGLSFASASNVSTAQRLQPISATGGGKLRWRFPIGNAGASSPTIANGVVYVGTGDGYVYALQASDGTRLWRYLTGGAVSTPTVVNGVVYFGSVDGYVYALKASDGTLRWRYQTGGNVASSPAVVKGVVYIGSSDGSLYALKASDGTLRWRYQADSSSVSSPVVVMGVVYFSASPDAGVGYVFALTA